jgi:hypothetical protein
MFYFKILKRKILKARKKEQNNIPVRDTLNDTMKKSCKGLFDYIKAIEFCKQLVQ